MLSPDEIHIHFLWLRNRKSPLSSKDFSTFLPAEERYKYQEAKSNGRDQEFLWSRLLMRGVLASYLKKNMRSLKFVHQDNGKPFLEKEKVQFSLSHTEGLIVLSLGQRAIGVDVENIQAGIKMGIHWERLARRYFSESEKKILFSGKRESRESKFFRIFTLKEAFGKVQGKGLSLGFKGFSVPLPLEKKMADGLWEFRSEFLQSKGFVWAHAAVNTSPQPLIYRLKQWDQRSLIRFITDSPAVSVKVGHGHHHC